MEQNRITTITTVARMVTTVQGAWLRLLCSEAENPNRRNEPKRYARGGTDRQERWLQNHDVSDYTDMFEE
ncbi:hypothetical protein OSG_eHP42_00040 [environmental Halophage eHP-42]|nr:hypothetical protein OSG_eHP42_00040 [environmental Halophage eHP-42]